VGFSFKSRRRNMLAAYFATRRTAVGSQSIRQLLTSVIVTRIDFGRLARDGAPLMFHAVGLWIGVDKMLAPLRETVKI
jgi:hypothetical protein